MSQRQGWALADTFIEGMKGRLQREGKEHEAAVLQQLHDEMNEYREKTLEPRWDKEDEALNGRR